MSSFALFTVAVAGGALFVLCGIIVLVMAEYESTKRELRRLQNLEAQRRHESIAALQEQQQQSIDLEV